MTTSPKDNTHRVEPKSDPQSGAAAKSSAEHKGATSPAGRITHDSRGNAVWSWGSSGDDSSATNSTSKMLKKLDLGDLRVEEDDAKPETQPDTKKGGSGYGAGYNPYDRTAPVRMAPKKAPSR